MSPWEIIGWAIAIPMVMMAGLFVFAIVVATFKAMLKPRKPPENHPAGRHLRLVEDD
jgi:hypothetical protein